MKEVIYKIKIPTRDDFLSWFSNLVSCILRNSFSPWTRIVNNNLSKRYLVFIGIIFVIFTWQFNLLSAFLSAIFFLFFFYEFDSRLLAMFALVLLISAPLSLILKHEALAESLSINSFFLLTMTVVLEIRYRFFGRRTVQEKTISTDYSLVDEKTSRIAYTETINEVQETGNKNIDLLSRGTVKDSEPIFPWLTSAFRITSRHWRRQPIIWIVVLLFVIVLVMNYNKYSLDYLRAPYHSEDTGSVKIDSATDTDGDGLTDLYETKIYHTDINTSDSDGDGLSDYEETMKYDTDPLKADTDGDGFSDKQELDNGYNPNGLGKLE